MLFGFLDIVLLIFFALAFHSFLQASHHQPFHVPLSPRVQNIVKHNAVTFHTMLTNTIVTYYTDLWYRCVYPVHDELML